jgi:hypothetical protein
MFAAAAGAGVRELLGHDHAPHAKSASAPMTAHAITLKPIIGTSG